MGKKETVYVPPIKIQGKKTQLVNFILAHLPSQYDTWIEPFMGSGVVGFNAKPKNAIFADSNPHIINFYTAIKNKEISYLSVKFFLEEQGKKLSTGGQDFYNSQREKFNKTHESLDFLFLNRCCFNGMIRFNRKFEFNVPYGHKPQRFSQAYITKITNQVKYIAFLIENNNWQFICQDFKATIAMANQNDFIYCDPPYIGRHVDYYDSWNEANELDLENNLSYSKANFILSTWHSNQYRSNEYIKTLWKNYNLATISHFYHLAAKEENRNPILEALIFNYNNNTNVLIPEKKPNCQQLSFSL